MLHLRPRTLVALLALATSLGVVGSALTDASAFGSSASSRYNLKFGDQVAVPATGWSCELALVQGSASFGCSPGKAGTSSQGEPVVSAQWKRLVIAGGRLPKMEALGTPKGPLRIWTYAVIRHR